MNHNFLKPFLILVFLFTTGCSTYVEKNEGQAFMPVEPPVNLALSEPSNGAIFQSSQNGLFATDQRARRVGDILTVRFNETYAATKAQTATSRHNLNKFMPDRI